MAGTTVQVVSAPATAPDRAAATPIAAEEVFEVAGTFDNIGHQHLAGPPLTPD